jgi:hypothetical protein
MTWEERFNCCLSRVIYLEALIEEIKKKVNGRKWGMCVAR